MSFQNPSFLRGALVVDAVVSGETFSTYVQTAQVGVNKFRVRDTDGPEVSNEVRVKVG